MNNLIGNKAVLIYPKFYGNTFWSFKKSLELYVPKNEFGLPKRSLPPLGLMGLFRYLKPYYKKLILIDRNVDPRRLRKIISNADHVYMGGMSAQEKGLMEDAKIIKDLGKPLILGGPIVDRTILEKEPLKSMKIIAVQNESELVMEDVLKDLSEKKFGNYYVGEHCRANDYFEPDFSCINLNNYISMAIQIGRGCPWNCEFCDITARFGRKARYSSKEKIRRQIKQLYDLGWRKDIFIVDDSFTALPWVPFAIESLKTLYEIEEELGHHFFKSAQVSLDLSNESENMREVRYWLKKTNFNMLFVGVETNNIESLKETGKNQNLFQGKKERSLKEKLAFISKETGAGVMLGIIHGFDNDTRESVDSLIDFINSTHCSIVMPGLLSAMPYTRLGDRIKKEGRFRKGDLGCNTDGIMGFVPYNFSIEEAERDYVKILERIYSEKAYFKRIEREINFFNPQSTKGVISIKEGIHFALNLMTKKYAGIYWKNLGMANRIARKNSRFLSPKYKSLMGLYFARCSRYTHFRSMIEYLQRRLKRKKYEEWEKVSWKEMQEKGD